jgi:CBS domain-containing protein
VIRALKDHGDDALRLPVSAVMTAPVVTVSPKPR